MMWRNYRLDSTILKTTDALTLWRTEKGIIEIGRNTLAIPIKLGDQRKGYIFHGHGKLLLDTIIETDEGAIGKPVEKEISEPFLMLGDAEGIQQHLSTAGKENLMEMGYENEQDFLAKAEDLFDHFLGEGKIHGHQCCGNNHGFIFAFPNKEGKLDILVAKGSRLVYKAMNRVFVVDKSKVVLKTKNEVILSTGGRKSFFIKK